MLRPLSFVSMRQEHRDAAQTPPLGLAGTNELIDDDLRTVDEIAELSFPDDKRVGFGRCIAVLKSKHRFFRQQRIDYAKRVGIVP